MAALLRAKAAIGKLSDDNADIQAGINIVLRALGGPDPPDRGKFRRGRFHSRRLV